MATGGGRFPRQVEVVRDHVGAWPSRREPRLDVLEVGWGALVLHDAVVGLAPGSTRARRRSRILERTQPWLVSHRPSKYAVWPATPPPRTGRSHQLVNT